MSIFEEQLEIVRTRAGFIAALDQSGGSTPSALAEYGISEDAYHSDAEMFDLVHQMRTRILTSRVFTSKQILAVILFDDTLHRSVEGKPTGEYLWTAKRIVPFLKVDQGLADQSDGVQLMKPLTKLDAMLERAKSQPVFGTKMRSVIHEANEDGISAVVKQQFEAAEQIAAAGFVPIIEPEVDIHSRQKSESETILKQSLLNALDKFYSPRKVMLKLTLPEQDNLYTECIGHKNVLLVVALSGGYTRDQADERLRRQKGMTASFSRALLEGLQADQTQQQFDTMLDHSIQKIFDASVAP